MTEDLLKTNTFLENVNDFLSKDKEPPGKDLYPDIFETLMFPLQRKRELIRMMQIARSINPKVVMEIGTDKGGGFYHWCNCLESVDRAIACEIRGTPFSEAFEERFPSIDFLWLDGVSSYIPETVNKVKNWLKDDKIDCLFLDGDKCAFDKDFETYLPYMASRSIVFIHDIDQGNPKQTFEYLTTKYETEIIYDKSEYDELTEPIPDSGYIWWLNYWKGTSCHVGVVYIK